MALDGSGRIEEVFLDEDLVEAWPGGGKSILDGFEPTCGGRAVATFMEIGDEVGFGFHFVDAVGSMANILCFRFTGWRCCLLLEINRPKFRG